MKTVIELYDDQSILNILAVCAMNPPPENLVFVGDFHEKSRENEIRKWAAEFLHKRGIHTKIKLFHVDTDDCQTMVSTLFKIKDEFPECALEVCGGKYLMLLAAGMFAEKSSIPLFHYNIDRKKFENIRLMPDADKLETPSFTAEEMIALSYAGKLNQPGHFSINELNDVMISDIRRIWDLFIGYKSDWHRKVLFFQGAVIDAGNPLRVSIDRTAVPESKVNTDYLRRMESLGLIGGIAFVDDTVSFTFKNPIVMAALRDPGAALELFTFMSLKLRKQWFSDCEINLRVDWDGPGPSRTCNELDVVAVCEVNTLFISCKSGKLETDHLNEIYTLTSRLGGPLAKPVLMTAALFPGRDNRAFLERGKDMGIEEIALSEICPRIARNEYKGIETCRHCSQRACERKLAERLHDLCK